MYVFMIYVWSVVDVVILMFLFYLWFIQGEELITTVINGGLEDAERILNAHPDLIKYKDHVRRRE